MSAICRSDQNLQLIGNLEELFGLWTLDSEAPALPSRCIFGAIDSLVCSGLWWSLSRLVFGWQCSMMVMGNIATCKQYKDAQYSVHSQSLKLIPDKHLSITRLWIRYHGHFTCSSVFLIIPNGYHAVSICNIHRQSGRNQLHTWSYLWAGLFLLSMKSGVMQSHRNAHSRYTVTVNRPNHRKMATRTISSLPTSCTSRNLAAKGNEQSPLLQEPSMHPRRYSGKCPYQMFRTLT